MHEYLVHPLIVLALKPILYIALYIAAAYFWLQEQPPHPWRYVAAGMTRCALGLLVGVPVGVLLADRLRKLHDGGAGFYGLYFALRLGLWVATTKLFFRPLTNRQVMLLALGGVALNALLDLLWTDHGGLRGEFAINFC